MDSTEKAQYIFSQINFRAGNIKRSLNGLAAAEFAAMNYDEKIDFMNDVVFPLYTEAGSPEPYTDEMVKFVKSVFLIANKH